MTRPEPESTRWGMMKPLIIVGVAGLLLTMITGLLAHGVVAGPVFLGSVFVLGGVPLVALRKWPRATCRRIAPFVYVGAVLLGVAGLAKWTHVVLVCCPTVSSQPACDHGRLTGHCS
jgi:hypothetical protein